MTRVYDQLIVGCVNSVAGRSATTHSSISNGKTTTETCQECSDSADVETIIQLDRNVIGIGLEL